MLTVIQARTKAVPTAAIIPKAYRFPMSFSPCLGGLFFRLADSLKPAGHLFKADHVLGHAVHHTYTRKRRFPHQVFDSPFVDRAVEGEGVVAERADDAQLLVAESADVAHPEPVRPG